jgi:hypothetical protein
MNLTQESVFQSFGESLNQIFTAKKIKEAPSGKREYEIHAFLHEVSRHLAAFEELNKMSPSEELAKCINSFRDLYNVLMPKAKKLIELTEERENKNYNMAATSANDDKEVEHSCDKVGEHSREAFKELFSETRERERSEIIREWNDNIRADLSDCIDIIRGKKGDD